MMERTFRTESLKQLAKMAGAITDLVQKELVQPPEKVNYAARIPLAYGAVAAIPANPFSPDGGVNVMFQFRYYQSAPPGAAAGINTVVVYADVNKAYNDPRFIASSISQIMGYLKKQNPNAHLAKYGLSAFSGGYWPVENLLRHRQDLERMVGKPLDAVFLADAGATRLNDAAMSGFTQFAQEASQPGSDKKFVVMHSAIPGQVYDPTTGRMKQFTSTTQHADWLMQHVGIENRRDIAPDDPRFAGMALQPKSIAGRGGFQVIQVDDNPNRTWDPRDKFRPGTSGWVHKTIGTQYLPQAWNLYLQDWNQD
jgi:hypothetical protein